MVITTAIILWLLPDQDTTHDIINVKRMTNKTDLYWKDIPGLSLPPDTCKYYNRVDLHINSRRAIFICLRLPFGTTPALA